MTSRIKLKKEMTSILILINKVEKLSISVENKAISTKKIYEILDYSLDKKYILEGTKSNNNKNEIDRLYNELYDLFNVLVENINNIKLK